MLTDMPNSQMNTNSSSNTGLLEVVSKGVVMFGGLARRNSLEPSTVDANYYKDLASPSAEADDDSLWTISPSSEKIKTRPVKKKSKQSMKVEQVDKSPKNQAKKEPAQNSVKSKESVDEKGKTIAKENRHISPISTVAQSYTEDRRTSTGHPLKVTVQNNGSQRPSPRRPPSRRRANSENNDTTKRTPSAQRSKEIRPRASTDNEASPKTKPVVRKSSSKRTTQRQRGDARQRDSNRSTSAPTPRQGKGTLVTVGKSMVENAYNSSFSELSEDQLFKLTRARVRGNSRWDFKGQIAKHEEVLKEVRSALIVINEGRKRFRTVCGEIEMSLQRELRDQRRLAAQLGQEMKTMEGELRSLRSSEGGRSKDLSELKRKMDLVISERDRMNKENSELKVEARKAAAAQAELEMKAAHAAGRAAEATSQMEKSQKEIKHLQSQQNLSTSEIESKWRNKLDDATSSLKEELASLKARLEAKEEELNRNTERKNELEVLLAKLNNDLLREKSDKMEGQMNHERASAEAERMKAELTATRSSLDQKSRELTMALESFSTMQKSSSSREDEMRVTMRSLEDQIRQLEHDRSELKEENTRMKATAAAHSTELTSLREKVDVFQTELAKQKEEYNNARMDSLAANEQLAVERQLRERAEMRESEERNERTAATAQLMAMASAHAADIERVKREKTEVELVMESKLSEMGTNAEKLKEELKQKQEQILQNQSEISTLRQACEDAASQMSSEQLEEMARVAGENLVLKQRLQELEANSVAHGGALEKKIAELDQVIREGERKRRKMHNLIQELRGNIRVFIRVRPFLPSDQVPDGTPVTPEPKDDGVSLAIRKMDGTFSVMEQQSFSFDKVFMPSTGQDQVFLEVSEFVQSALDGYNVCLFSYGQTGSGKTHTMQGSGTGPMKGIIPRAMEQVGVYRMEMEGQGWAYQMSVSLLEIYNETIQDLLWPLAENPEQSKTKKREIKRDPAGDIYVTELTKIAVDPSNQQQIDEIMEIAARHRSVGSTDMNAQSSRSHSVFTLHLKATNLKKGSVMTGKLNLVDLAGSERLSRSGATGDRLKETQAINKSLSCLTDVFLAISRKNSHVPFRNSKLTHLLQPALSGDGKTLMMVNLSPTQESYFESLSSLRFGSHVNQCELGKAKRHFKDLGSEDSKVSPSTRRRGTIAAPGLGKPPAGRSR